MNLKLKIIGLVVSLLYFIGDEAVATGLYGYGGEESDSAAGESGPAVEPALPPITDAESDGLYGYGGEKPTDGTDDCGCNGVDGDDTVPNEQYGCPPLNRRIRCYRIANQCDTYTNLPCPQTELCCPTECGTSCTAPTFI